MKKLSLTKNRIFLISIIIVITILLIIYFVLALNFNSKERTEFSVFSIPEFKFNDLSISARLEEDSKVESNSLNMLVLGDIQAGDFLAEEVRGGQDPFINVKDLFKQYDLVVAGSEGSISEDGVGTAQDKGYVYKAPLRYLDLYQDAGIDIVTLANNHTMDYGADALVNQMNVMDSKEIIYFGAGNNADEAFYPRMIIKNGVKIGFVGINDIENHITDVGENSPGLAYHYSWRTEGAIRKARELCDIVIVVAHWGFEHSTYHDPYQEQWARQFIGWGADMVVGSHVHVRQDSTVIDGKPVFYSLGNYAYTGFGWNPESLKGSMIHVKIQDKKIVKTALSTVNIEAYGGFPSLEGDQPDLSNW